MTISPLSEVTDRTQTTTTQNNSTDKEAFLQLLVTQIKNQNPLDPADGAEFLTQLAQFSELEQMMAVRSEISALRTEMTAAQEAQKGE
jgi:flagellar basal-body rod modification protein FlgD